MSKSDDLENNFLKLYYTAVAHAGWADNAAASTKTHIMFALHTADPGDAGAQNTSESAYTSYARAAKTRDTNGTTGFAVTGNSCSPNTAVTFPAGTGGSAGPATHFSTGGATSSTPTTGATAILHSGAISPTITTGNGVTPQLAATTAVTED